MKKISILVILVLLLSKSLFAVELQKVSLQLPWLNQFQFAGFYIAQEYGYYEDVGLDVQIKPFTHQNDKLSDVLSDIKNQTTTYAIGKSSLIIEQSKSEDFVILDAIFEHSPSVLVTANVNIKYPKNKKKVLTSDQANASSLYALLISQGISKNDILQQDHLFDMVNLSKGDADVMASYILNEPSMPSKRGVDFTILNPKDYGYDFYGDLLFTSVKELQENPERAKKFVQASRKGWAEAFNNVEVTAKLIFEKYNDQNKSLKSLITEGTILKALWCDDPKTGPVLDYKRFDEISDIYILNNLISKKPDFKKFLDPLNFNRQEIVIGILAEHGVAKAVKAWTPLIENMNFDLPKYNIILKLLNFEEIDQAVEKRSVDFVLTNSMQYIQLEAKYGTSRMATLINKSPKGPVNRYGAVIFTHADNKKISTLKDLKKKTFAAVNPASFGGWIMAKKTLLDADVKETDFKSLKFLQTHDNVVEAVLNKSVEAGTVKTDTLEALSSDGEIDLTKIKVLHQLHYDDFPYLVSTELYPEWSFANVSNTNLQASNAILSNLLDSERWHSSSLPNWSIPSNYKPIRDLLRTLKMEPFKPIPITYKSIVKEYSFVFLGIVAVIVTLLVSNRYLNAIVRKRTKELIQVNEKLELLAHTDELTNIANRRQFLQMAEQYFQVSKRNKTSLVLLALDIDWFKDINDTYGHHIGDEVLKLFTRTLEKHLRKSDLFGRIGGEEFSILLQNTSDKDALAIAEKMREGIEETPYILKNKEQIHFTVSIGISSMRETYNEFSDLMKVADKALYKAKETNRNKVVVL